MAANGDITFDDAMKVVEELAKEIWHHRHGLRIAEVLKAGSLGQYTAVPGSFDVDLVVYSDDADPKVVLTDGYGEYLHKLRSFLGGLLRVNLKPPTKMTVPLTYDEIDVDILVSPNWKSPEEFYKFLKDAKQKDGATSAELFRFSVNASRWQVDFIKKQNDEVKELIRRAKAWRDREWPRGKHSEGRPKSYLISLLVLRAYETASKKFRGRIKQGTSEEVKEIVEDHHRANIYWDDYYNPQDYYPDLILASRPRIIDPANPANNLYDTGIVGGYTSYSYELGDGKWTELVSRIDSIDLTKSVKQIQGGDI